MLSTYELICSQLGTKPTYECYILCVIFVAGYNWGRPLRLFKARVERVLFQFNAKYEVGAKRELTSTSSYFRLRQITYGYIEPLLIIQIGVPLQKSKATSCIANDSAQSQSRTTNPNLSKPKTTPTLCFKNCTFLHSLHSHIIESAAGAAAATIMAVRFLCDGRYDWSREWRLHELQRGRFTWTWWSEK